MNIRVGKTGSLGPWSRVILYCRSVRMLAVIPLIHLIRNKILNLVLKKYILWVLTTVIPLCIAGSFLTLLQYTMTLLQGPKDPVLPSLMNI